MISGGKLLDENCRVFPHTHTHIHIHIYIYKTDIFTRFESKSPPPRLVVRPIESNRIEWNGIENEKRVGRRFFQVHGEPKGRVLPGALVRQVSRSAAKRAAPKAREDQRVHHAARLHSARAVSQSHQATPDPRSTGVPARYTEEPSVRARYHASTERGRGGTGAGGGAGGGGECSKLVAIDHHQRGEGRGIGESPRLSPGSMCV